MSKEHAYKTALAGDKKERSARPASLQQWSPLAGSACTTLSVSHSTRWHLVTEWFHLLNLLPMLFSHFLSNDIVSFLPNFLFLGFHFNSIPKPVSLPQAPLPSAPSSFLPFSPLGPPFLGCCETPVVSLAEAQQELQMLQKQLGESEHVCCPVCLRVAASHCVALHGFGLMAKLENKQTVAYAISRRWREGSACLFWDVFAFFIFFVRVSHQLQDMFRKL